MAAFFDEPWSRFSPNLGEADQAWLLINRALTGLGLDLRPDDSYPPDLDLLVSRGAQAAPS